MRACSAPNLEVSRLRGLMSRSVLGHLPYPERVCASCGKILGQRPDLRNFVLSFGTCDVCLATDTPCAKPSDWGELYWPPPSEMRPKIETLEQLIPYVLGEFDFQKVRDCMKLTNWKWAMPGGRNEIPKIEDIKAQAARLLREAIVGHRLHGAPYTVATGGVYATADAEGLNVQFVLEDAYSELEDFT